MPELMDAERLMRNFPSAEWRKPIMIKWLPGTDIVAYGMDPTSVFACRICIAMRGLNRCSTWQWTEITAAETHIERHFQ